MDRVSVRQVAEWAGGALATDDPDALVGPDVVIDSRRVTPGAVYVALPGERVDGHDFVAAATAAGAGAVLVTHPVDVAVPHVVVADTVAGLSRLAHGIVTSAQRHSGLVVIGVTGSSGKTTTKDLLAQVLAAAGPTVAPAGSFNNEIGAPLTAAQVDRRTRFLVSEMGARGVGHVAWLCSITPPTVGAVLNVGHAHLGEFGSIDTIAQAKGELVEALPEDGWAVLNADDARVAGMATRTRARVAFFSATGEPDAASAALRVWATDVVPDQLQRHAFILHVAGAATGTAPVTLRLMGAHQVANALAAAAVALAAGLSLAQVADALSAAGTLSRWRMELQERPDGVVVLNDAYNANPDSMAAALSALAGLRRPGGRLIAVLGDMLELGPGSAEAHRRIGTLAAQHGIDELCAVGSFADELVAGFVPSGRAARYFAGKDEVAEHLRGTVGAPDVVLVKASRGLGLETVADALLAADDEGAHP